MDTDPTVFIVDDDQGVRDAVTLLMESIGLAAEGYASAQGYLDAFDPRRPGCLVLDVRMRGMSGLELQERLAAEPFTLPLSWSLGMVMSPWPCGRRRPGPWISSSSLSRIRSS